MKKCIVCLIFSASMIFASKSDAANRKYVSDFENNNGDYLEVSCPSGTRLIGFAYVDFKNDSADAASIICEGAGGETTIPKNSDWLSTKNEMIEQKCNSDEIVWGISYKDRENMDAMDGLRTICKNNTTEKIRYTHNPDIEGGSPYINIFTNVEEVIGMFYQDGGCGDKESDCIDAVTIITK